MKLDDQKAEFIAMAISGLFIIAVLIMITYAAVYFQGVNQREKYIIETHSEIK